MTSCSLPDPIRLSDLLARLETVQPADARWLAADPLIHGAAALHQAGRQQLGFLERNSHLATHLQHCNAAALLLPADEGAMHRQAEALGIAWVACRDPRLSFAEALACLYPRRPPEPGRHPRAVVAAGVAIPHSTSVAAGVVVQDGCRLGENVVLHPGVVLHEDVWLGDGCELHANAVVHPGSRLGVGCVVHANAVIGAEGFGFVPTSDGWRKMPQIGRVVLDDHVEVGSGTTIDRPAVGETRIGAGTKIDNLVQVGHGVVIGRGCALAAQVGLAGGVVLGDGVTLGGQVGIANRCRIGDRAVVYAKSGIISDVEAGAVVSGFPAIPNRRWLRAVAAFAKLPELGRSLQDVQRRLNSP